MHYEKRYAHPSREVNDAQALRAVEEYLGAERFTHVCEVASQAESEDHLRLLCSLFLGIEGYPVGALWRTFAQKEPL